MRPIAEQLDAVRRRARALLVTRRAFQFVAVAAPTAVMLGLTDYLLRFPGGLRLVVGLALLVVGGGWLLGRLGRAWSFAPPLSELALRAERLFPDLRGLLASGLELSDAGGLLREAGSVSAGLSSSTVAEAERRTAGRDFGKLIDARSTRKVGAAALAGALVLVSTVLVSPASARIAAQRWLLPLGDTAWPLRYAVELLTPPTVLAADTPVDLRAAVTRGDTPGLRVWLRYRFEHDGTTDLPAWRGAEQRLLMSPQRGVPASDAGDVENTERATDPPDDNEHYAAQASAPPELIRRLEQHPGGGWLVFTVEAGDDATDEHTVPVVPRPALRSATATVTPPAYARPYRATQRLTLDPRAERLGTINALYRAEVTVDLVFNSALPGDPDSVAAWFEGLPEEATVELRTHGTPEASSPGRDTDTTPPASGMTLRWTATGPASLQIELRDRHGLTDTTPRRLRVTTTPDTLPTVTLFEPATDQSVLPAAVVPVRAEAGDDVALNRLLVGATHPDHANANAEGELPTQDTTLAEVAQLRDELDATLDLRLSTLNVRPGDTVELTAAAWDEFDESAGARGPAWAIPRRLTIIDAATLMTQVQRELAAVRRAAERLRAEQGTLRRSAPPSPADMTEPQGRITRGMRPPAQRLDDVAERLEQNRLEEPELDALLARAQALLEQAGQASDQARGAFDEAQDNDDERAEQGRAAQADVEQKLAELTDLLDQGGDALGLRLEVAGLRAEQENLALDTRQLLPQTAGRSLDELTDAQREAIERLAERQGELAERAEDLVRRMASTAESLAQQSERDADQAAAEALAEAADTARRDGLSPTMQGGAQAAQRNQLSEAGQQQLDALDTLDRMLEQIAQQEQKRRERLQRRLRQLAERIERLIRDQRAALEQLEALAGDDAAVVALAEPEAALWQRIIAVQTDAERAAETADAAPLLGNAADAAAAAVAALRLPDAEAAQAREQATIEQLEAALEAVREAQRQQQQEDADRQRAELRQAYLDLADAQDELAERTAPVVSKERLDRRDRATLRTLGGEQLDLGQRVAGLHAKVEAQLTFDHMHGRIDALVSRTADALQRADGVSRVSVDQARVAMLLRAMADALTPPPKQNDFQDSGGGGGGGGGGQTEVIPPAAQLKLLRAVQSMLLDETRLADEQIGGEVPAEGPLRDAVDDLAARQRELTGLAERLKEQLEEARRQGGMELRPDVAPPDAADESEERVP